MNRIAHRILPRLRSMFRDLANDAAGNILLWTALSVIPMMGLLGFGIDYARAERAQTRLNAAADASALAAVDPSLAGLQDTDVKAAVEQLFRTQAANITGVTIQSVTATPVTGTSQNLGYGRTVVVSYTATAASMFSGLFSFTGSANLSTLTIKGSSNAQASYPPSINFYVMLDTSPSMLLPTSDTGISTLKAATNNSWGWTSGSPAGCAFACHEANSNPNNMVMNVTNTAGNLIWLDSSGNPHPLNNSYYGQSTVKDTSGTSYVASTGKYADTWWLARNFGSVRSSPASIQLRVDAETLAAQNLITFAQSTVQNYNTVQHPVTYKMQFYQFNYGNPTAVTGSLADVTTLSSSTVPDLGAMQANLYQAYYWTTSSVYTGDSDTDVTSMLNAMSSTSTIPNPGDGSTPSVPQAVLFIVTDGLADQSISGGSCQGVSGRGCQQWTSSHLSQCTAIKNRGVRIAILYTEYLASSIQNSGLSFADSVASTNVPQIPTQLQSCASTNPDGSKLYYKVSSNQDISAALTKLFTMAVQTARLTK